MQIEVKYFFTAQAVGHIVLTMKTKSYRINDHADAMSKAGYRVCFNYNQIWAVRRVLKTLDILTLTP